MSSAHQSHDAFAIPKTEIKGWAWVLIFTLCFNATFPSVVKNLFFSSSKNVLLCAAGGYQWVSVLSVDASEKNQSHCVFCLNVDDVVDYFTSFDTERSQLLNSKRAFNWLGLHNFSPDFFLPLQRAPPVFS